MHAGDMLAAEGSSLSLVKKECGGGSTLVEVIGPTALDCLSKVDICSPWERELLRDIMGRVLATGSPMNLRDTSEVKTQTYTSVEVVMTRF